MSNYTTIVNKLETGLIQNINKCSMVNELAPNYLLAGHTAAEKIMDCREFKVSGVTDVSKEGIYDIGYFLGYKVYVDLYMDKNTILIQYDKKSMRDNKLESILEEDVKEL